VDIKSAAALDLCTTCYGVLRLQDRIVRSNGRLDHERVLAEARWFLATLEKVRPCASHKGVTRLARYLTEKLDAAEAGKEALVCSGR
jgi:hypothetical protein